jgi:hypothetical protein
MHLYRLVSAAASLLVAAAHVSALPMTGNLLPLGATPSSVCPDAFLALDQATLVINDDASSAELMVRMNYPPTEAETVVHIAAPGIGLDRCTLTFTPANYNQSQRVRVVPDANFYAKVGTGQAYTISFAAKLNCIVCQQSLPVRREYTGVGGTCKTWGDPHYITFSLKPYDSYGLGDYYVFKSADLAIQTRHVYWQREGQAGV